MLIAALDSQLAAAVKADVRLAENCRVNSCIVYLFIVGAAVCYAVFAVLCKGNKNLVGFLTVTAFPDEVRFKPLNTS